ncbi:zinc finger, CCHC-type containing protein [Tanacetum coccineum]
MEVSTEQENVSNDSMHVNDRKKTHELLTLYSNVLVGITFRLETSKEGRKLFVYRQLTAPYSPQQNGVVERRNRTVLSTTRSMMKAMKLPLTFWAEAVRHAIYILNRVPTRALIDKTPYEALYNRKPNLENLRIFGCTAYAKITIPHLKKLDDRSIPMIYLGVEEGSKACRLYDPIAKKKHVSRDVKFMETKPWDWNKDEEDTSTQDTFWTSFVVDGVDDENTTPVNTEINDNIDNTYQEQDPINDPNSPITPSTYTYNPHSDEEQDEATISSIENLENGFDHVPVRGFKNLTEIYQNTQEVETETLLFTEEEPRNYKEASTDKKWIEAMEIELDSINKNNTWTLTTLPPDQKAIGLKWVYKTKRDAEGKIIKYKARLVAKGYVQEKGISTYKMAGDDTASTSTPLKPVAPIAQYQCPKLKTTNYTVWAIQIKVILEAYDLWEAIEPKEGTEVDNKKDKATTAFLYQALTEDVILQVAGCETAKELWDSLKTRNVGEEKVQQARLQSLMIGFNTLQMKDDDTVDAFTAKLNGYATKAKELGKTLDESLLVRKLLDSTPDRFIQIVASIEQTSDLDDISLDEITGKLKAFEERIKLRKGGQVESQENLLFAHGEHSGKGRRFSKRGVRSNFSQGNWRNNRNRNNSQGGNSNHKGNSNKNKGEWDLSKVRCYKCQKLGHLKKDCRGTSTTQEQSNLILEDDEPSLLMTTHEEILLNEGQIQPEKYASGDASIWYLDNGASNHMTGVKSHFKDIDESVTGRVRFGDGSYVQIKGRGSILLGCRNHEQKIVSDVYYIPNLKSNILSLGQLTEIGCKVIMDGNKLTLYDKSKKLLMKVERSKNRLYSIRLQIDTPICLLANVDNQAWLWHARLGHLNFDDINKMTRKGLVEGIPRINHAGQICDACLLGKHSRTPFPNQAKFRSKNPLDLVYGDLCGPISPATYSGKKLIFLLVDDCTRFMWAYFLTSKDQAFSTFKEFRQKIEMEMRMKVRMLRTDRGGEFTSNEFTRYCKENGIARQLTAPYSPQQNGVVERRNRTVLSTTRSMMKAMKLPLTFWAEAVRHAIYILNRVPTRALEDKTPYEALYNRKPNLENLRIFGCTAYAKVTIPHLKKLDDRSIPMIYLGVEEGSKACRLYDPIAKKKHVSRDVKFMEIKPWDWDRDEEDTSTQDTFWTSFVVEGVDNENATPVNIEINDNIDNPYQEQDPINDPNSPITPSPYNYNPHSEEEATTSSTKNSGNIFDHVPVRGFKDLAEIYQNTQEVETQTLLFTEEEPRNYKEASTDQKWIEAMEIELDSINKNNTWTLTTLPPNQKAIGLKWVYKTKRDAKGKIIKYKARLVAKGYVQEQGIDFDEVFAPVARIETVRLILALAAYHGWQVHHLDVKSAFLHGELKEEVYVTQPEGFVQQGNSGKVYKLTKALYGLRQAPRAWNVKLDQTLKLLNFKKCNLEQAVYTRRSKTSTLIVGVYVDDLIITGTPRKEIDAFKSQMQEKFEMSDLGLLAYYLGIEVAQTGGEITIKQTGYINKILKETSMTDSNDTKIPMDPGTKLVKAEDENSVDATYYRSLIGSLRYLLHTRPDLSYSIGLLSRFMQDPKDHHLKAAKQVIRYIKGTKEHGIIYKKEGGCKITGYSDSSYGINTDQGRGTTGIVFYFGESPITWCTQKQPTVALSSCESEFMAATGAACQALWLKRLLNELTGWEEKRITLKVDNVSAIALVRNPVFHGRSKHIDIRYHFIRECVENGHINVEHVSGELQRADILTKALPRLKFVTMRQMLGVQDLGRSNDKD